MNQPVEVISDETGGRYIWRDDWWTCKTLTFIPFIVKQQKTTAHVVSGFLHIYYQLDTYHCSDSLNKHEHHLL